MAYERVVTYVSILPKDGRSSIFSYTVCQHPVHFKTRQKWYRASKEICNAWVAATVDRFGLKDRFSIIYGFYFKLSSRCRIILE
jgi:hypothetical protein